MNPNLSKLKLVAEIGKLKQKFGRLTDDDLLQEEGQKEENDWNSQSLHFQTDDELNEIYRDNNHLKD
jgi:hypothetical protein